MITQAEALNYLKLEAEDLPKEELTLVEGLIAAAGIHLQNATGYPPTAYKDSDQEPLATLFCKMVIGDWYNTRQTVGAIGTGAKAIITQLQNCPPKVSESDTTGGATGETP